MPMNSSGPISLGGSTAGQSIALELLQKVDGTDLQNIEENKERGRYTRLFCTYETK